MWSMGLASPPPSQPVARVPPTSASFFFFLLTSCSPHPISTSYRKKINAKQFRCSVLKPVDEDTAVDDSPPALPARLAHLKVGPWRIIIAASFNAL